MELPRIPKNSVDFVFSRPPVLELMGRSTDIPDEARMSRRSSTTLSRSYHRRSVAYHEVHEEDDCLKLASHIWGGQISHDGYMTMLERVRQQFKQPQMHGHDPLTFPPQLPSSLRTYQPEVPKFSRGIRLLHEAAAASGGAGAVTCMQDDSTNSIPMLADTTASLPIAELSGPEEKYVRLLDLERLERTRLESTEKWDRSVVNEMMVVHFVTYVLKPEMEEIQARERFVRGMLRYEEEKEFYFLFNESTLAQLIRTEREALLKKKMKLSRLVMLDTEFADRKKPGSVRSVPQSSRRSFRSIHSSPITTGSGEGLPNSVGVEVETKKLPNQEADARSILQRYVRQKHGKALDEAAETLYTPTTARRLSTLHLPPVASAPRRHTLGVADYVNLLDEDDQYRAMIEVAERDERSDITRLMKENWNAVMDWQRKYMHLQRLVYWRAEREDNLKKELEKMSCTEVREWTPEALASVEQHEREEQRSRAEVEEDEELSFRILQESELQVFHRDQQQDASHEAVVAYHKLMRDCTLDLSSIVEAEESSTRAVMNRAYNKFVEQTENQVKLLRLLYQITVKPSSYRAVLTIQRAFYRYRRGLMGHRRTHQKLGEVIQAKRTQERLTAGQEVFRTYCSQIQAEIDELNSEALAEFVTKSQALIQEESRDRMIFASHEAMGYTSIKRAFVKALKEDVIGLYITRMLAAEVHGRRENTVLESLDFSATLSFFKLLSNLIQRKAAAVTEETQRRSDCEAEESAAIQQLLALEYDRREEIRIDAEEAAERRREELRQESTALYASHGEISQAMLSEHFLFINRQEQRGVTKMAFERIFYDEHISESIAAWNELWASWAVGAHRVLGTVDCREHQELIHLREVELMEESEKLTRRATEKSEDDMIWTLREAYQKMVEDSKEEIDEEHRAVDLLAETWRKYKSGDLGRSATRKYLHEAFRVKREKCEIAKKKSEVMGHIRDVKEQLGKEEEKQRKERKAEVDVLLSVLEHRTEPRARFNITDSEDLIFTIMRNNFFSAGIRAFDPRNTMALLWQQESYERVMIRREWYSGFTKDFDIKKATFREDVMIRPIQRAWRAYVQRRNQNATNAAAQEVVMQAELSNRLYIMEREAVFYAELYHEVMNLEWEAGMLFSLSSSRVPDQEAAAFRSLVAQEWEERVDLLWEMRYHLGDGVLADSEARERRSLVDTVFNTGLSVAHFYDEEMLTRQLLKEERSWYLLRILCRQEKAHREALELSEQCGATCEWLYREESMRRQRIQEEYCVWWRDAVYAPLAELTAHELEVEEADSRYTWHCLREQHEGRDELAEEERVARQRLVMLMERMLRGLIHTNEQFERQGSVVLCWKEERERIEIMAKWSMGMTYGPSSFAPQHVYEELPVYERCIEQSEALVRSYLETSEKSASEFLFQQLTYLQQEYTTRQHLNAEEHVTRDQQLIVIEEQEQRAELVGEWARGMRYVPSSFAPEIVYQNKSIFTNAVVQEECISREFIHLSEEVAFRNLRHEKNCLDYEQAGRAALIERERVELQLNIVSIEEAEERKKLVEAFQSGLFYAPSSFAPRMVNHEVPLFIQCILDGEDLVRHAIDNDEAEWRRFFTRDKSEKEIFLKELWGFEKGLRDARTAVFDEELAARGATWREAFEFIVEAEADEEGGEVVNQYNERYTTFVEALVALEQASRMYIYGRYSYGLARKCKKLFPEISEELFDTLPIPREYLCINSDGEDEDELDRWNREETLMFVRTGGEEDAPVFEFVRANQIPAAAPAAPAAEGEDGSEAGEGSEEAEVEEVNGEEGETSVEKESDESRNSEIKENDE